MSINIRDLKRGHSREEGKRPKGRWIAKQMCCDSRLRQYWRSQNLNKDAGEA